MSAVVLEDYYKPYFKKSLTETQANWLLRSVVVFLGALSLGLQLYQYVFCYGMLVPTKIVVVLKRLPIH